MTPHPNPSPKEREIIENEFLKIEIALAGAELASIFHKKSGREYLWQGDPAWWPRRAPVLFPIVGKLNSNAYHLNGTRFELPQHGFARDQEFTIQEKSNRHVKFVLHSNETLLKKYPFQFELIIGYNLFEERVEVHYEVKNSGPDPMYFSIGAHPGFALATGEKLSDYVIEFEKAETLDRYLLEEGLFNGMTERVLTNQKELALNDELFTKDAIVFKEMKSHWLILKSTKSNYRLTVTLPDFPYFGIWSKPGASFVCLEPWCGMADNKGFNGDISLKEGIRMLPNEGNFSRAIRITPGV